MITLPEYLNRLQQVHILAAVLMAIVGGVYLLLGWKIFKILVILNALIIGVLVGGHFGQMLQKPHMDVILGVAGGLLLAALSWPLMKWAVSVMGALAGAAVGFGLWRYAALATGRTYLIDLSWVGALIGLITLGLLAFIVFKAVVVLFTSIQGSGMMVSGVLALICREPTWRNSLQTTLTNNTYLLPLIIVVPALLGAIFQQSLFGKGKKDE